MPSVLKSNQLIGIFTIKAQDGGHRSDRSCSVVEDVVHIVVQCRGREERDEQQEKEEQEVWAAPALWALFPRPRATRPTSALLHSFLEHCNVSITIEISIELFLITHSAFYWVVLHDLVSNLSTGECVGAALKTVNALKSIHLCTPYIALVVNISERYCTMYTTVIYKLVVLSLDWIQEVWDTNGGHCVAQRGIKVLAPCASIPHSFAFNSSHSPHFQFNFWELRWFLVVYRGNNLCSEKAWGNIGSQMQYILSTYTLDRTASQNLGILSRDCTVVHIWLLTELDLTIFMLNSAINARIGFNCNACLNSYFLPHADYWEHE